MEIRIKYFTDAIEPLRNIAGKSDWIDLRAAEEIVMQAGEISSHSARSCHAAAGGI